MAQEAIHQVDPVCKYCQGTLDFEPFMDLRKTLPVGIHHRMSFGVLYDAEGNPYHEFVWQCIAAWELQQGV